MARKKLKGFGLLWFWVVALLTIIGGLEHVLLSYGWFNFSILGLFPSAVGMFLQLLAGAVIAWAGIWMLMRK